MMRWIVKFMEDNKEKWNKRRAEEEADREFAETAEEWKMMTKDDKIQKIREEDHKQEEKRKLTKMEKIELAQMGRKRWKNWRDERDKTDEEGEGEEELPGDRGGDDQRPKHESLEERNGLPCDGEPRGLEGVNISTRKIEGGP